MRGNVKKRSFKSGLYFVFAVSIIFMFVVTGKLSVKAASLYSMNAYQIITEFKNAGHPVENIINYSAATDDNHLLGRPNQYTSKVNFADSRLSQYNSSDPNGGTIEVFNNYSDALKRKQYLDIVYNSFPRLRMYIYQYSNVLVRLSFDLTPDQTGVYQDGFRKLQEGSLPYNSSFVKISHTKLTLLSGKSSTLKITGTQNRVKWSNNKKSVINLSSKGKITAKKSGTATVTASVDGRKLTCKVTVKKLRLNKKNINLTYGSTAQLKVYNTKRKIKWNSSSRKIAGVSSKGKVTPNRLGKVKITANDGYNKLTCSITVVTPKLNKNELTMKCGQAYNLKYYGTKNKARWYSENASVAAVNEAGKVTGKGVGKTRIVADFNGVKSYCTINIVKTPVEEVRISPGIGSVKIGGKIKLTANIIPTSATNKNVIWKSENAKIASVDHTGIVTGISEGTTRITATADGHSHTITIEVSKILVEKITMSVEEASMNIGDEFIINASVFPANATNPNVEWSSSNPSIVTVDQQGRVKAIQAGRAYIVAMSEGCQPGYCLVDVK